MLVLFYSDTNYVLDGFELHASLDLCDASCQQGTCVAGRCACNPGWSGQRCQQELCPSNCTDRYEWRGRKQVATPKASHMRALPRPSALKYPHHSYLLTAGLSSHQLALMGAAIPNAAACAPLPLPGRLATKAEPRGSGGPGAVAIRCSTPDMTWQPQRPRWAS